MLAVQRWRFKTPFQGRKNEEPNPQLTMIYTSTMDNIHDELVHNVHAWFCFCFLSKVSTTNVCVCECLLKYQTSKNPSSTKPPSGRTVPFNHVPKRDLPRLQQR
ncbi:hypothetical protein Mapa_001401 [Marchantia paleacea]|nr:hypothetical protein Mapa_001401 [Marchantia paleacea]